MRFPFAESRRTVQPPAPARKPTGRARAAAPPAQVVLLQGEKATLGASTYRLTPGGQGTFLCSRPNSPVPVGTISPHGVRKALTADFFRELAILQAAVYGRPSPLPICYEMDDRTFVHPGPCFEQHASHKIRRTRNHMTEDSDARCAVCKESFL